MSDSRIPGAPTGVRVRSHVGGLAVYAPGASTGVPAGVPIVKLSSNEGAEGPTAAAIAAMTAAGSDLNRYPDSNELAAAIAAMHGLSPDTVAISPGADMSIGYLASAFLGPGDDVVFAWPAFVTYALAAEKQQAQAIRVPLKDDTHDLAAMLAAITPQTSLVYVCNPNNPTGTYVSRDALRAFVDALPDHVVCVVDEAYAEYVQEDDYPDAIAEYVRAGHPRVAVLRSFSKIYGLAGLRVGYLAAPAWIIDVSMRVRGPFDVNSMATSATLASIADTATIERRAHENGERRESLRTKLAAVGVATTGVANFLTVTVPDAQATAAELMQHGVLVRPLNGFGAPDKIRVTIGTDDDMARAEPILVDVLGR